jgi:hypothetical protein
VTDRPTDATGLIATGQTPLIVVIVLAFGLGILADRLLLVRAKRKHSAES